MAIRRERISIPSRDLTYTVRPDGLLDMRQGCATMQVMVSSASEADYGLSLTGVAHLEREEDDRLVAVRSDGRHYRIGTSIPRFAYILDSAPNQQATNARGSVYRIVPPHGEVDVQWDASIKTRVIIHDRNHPKNGTVLSGITAVEPHERGVLLRHGDGYDYLADRTDEPYTCHLLSPEPEIAAPNQQARNAMGAAYRILPPYGEVEVRWNASSKARVVIHDRNHPRNGNIISGIVSLEPYGAGVLLRHGDGYDYFAPGTAAPYTCHLLTGDTEDATPEVPAPDPLAPESLRTYFYGDKQGYIGYAPNADDAKCRHCGEAHKLMTARAEGQPIAMCLPALFTEGCPSPHPTIAPSHGDMAVAMTPQGNYLTHIWSPPAGRPDAPATPPPTPEEQVAALREMGESTPFDFDAMRAIADGYAKTPTEPKVSPDARPAMDLPFSAFFTEAIGILDLIVEAFKKLAPAPPAPMTPKGHPVGFPSPRFTPDDAGLEEAPMTVEFNRPRDEMAVDQPFDDDPITGQEAAAAREWRGGIAVDQAYEPIDSARYRRFLRPAPPRSALFDAEIDPVLSAATGPSQYQLSREVMDKVVGELVDALAACYDLPKERLLLWLADVVEYRRSVGVIPGHPGQGGRS